MKSLLVCPIVMLGLSATAFGSLTATLSPSLEVYPPGADTATCQTYSPSSSSTCVIFSGTLTDTDTDGSALYLTSANIVYSSPGDASYLTLDNIFYDYPGVPGVLEGDNLDSFAPNSYSGVIFGVDVLPSIPAGVYNEQLQLQLVGGTSDPDDNGYTQNVDFTVVVAPEPASALTITGGLLVIAASLRARSWRRC
jgi:hypothetical protein